jgi:hypothetical protein
VMMNLEKRSSTHVERFPKILFALSWCRFAKDNGFRDLPSRSQMHVDDQDEVALVVPQQRRRKPRCVGGSWLFVVTSSMAAARIYREDLPRVTVSHTRLGLSLSKCIRHGLVIKINSKRKSWTYEALSQISTDHSHARRAPTPIASPRPAPPGEAR